MGKSKEKEYKKNWVTLYTDASRHEDGLMAWSFYARHDGGRIQNAGMCPPDLLSPTNNINQGEMYAICQGMHQVLKKLDNVEGFYITTDSKNSIVVLKGKSVELSKKGHPRLEETVRLKKAFNKMVEDRNLSVDFRHIKSHSGKKTVRHWINDWCDKILKKVIKEYREKQNVNVNV